MLFNFCLFVYSIILLYPVIFKGKIDWFCPPTIYSLLMAFNTIPYLIMVQYTRDNSMSEIVSIIGTDWQNELYWFLINQSIFNVVYYITFYNLRIQVGNLAKEILVDKYNLSDNKFFYLVLYALGLYLSISFVRSQGGIEMLLFNMADRSKMMEDNQMLYLFNNFIVYFAGAYHIKYMSKNGVSYIQLFLNLILALFMLSIFGGRSPFIQYLIFIGMCYNYFVKKFSLLSVKLLPLYGFVAFFLVIMLLFRHGGAENGLDSGSSSDTFAFLNGNWYVDIQMFIHHHFSKVDFWFGRSFHDMYEIFLPRSVFPDKRPIDDGTYIFNIMYYGGDVLASNRVYSSWPPGTLGCGFSNFGLIGVIIGAFLLSVVHKYSLEAVRKTNYTPTGMYLYCFIVVKFQVTVFYIANLIYSILFVIILTFIARFFFRTNKVPNK